MADLPGFRHLALEEVARFAAAYDASQLPPLFEEMCALWADVSMLAISLRDSREYWGFPASGPLQAVVSVTPQLGPSELNERTIRYLGVVTGTVRVDWGPEAFRIRSHPAVEGDICHLRPQRQVDTFRRFLTAPAPMPAGVDLQDQAPADARPLWHNLWCEHEQQRGATTDLRVLHGEADDELRKAGQRWAVIRLQDRPVAMARWVRVGDTAVLSGAYVLPEWRRQGLGLTLIDARLADAAQAGCIEVVSQAADPESIRNLGRAGLEMTATFYYIR